MRLWECKGGLWGGGGGGEGVAAADTGFPREMRAPTYYSANFFSENCMKLKTIGPGWAGSKICLCRSVTGLYVQNLQCVLSGV